MSTTADFICLIHHGPASCDELHVQQHKGGWVVQLRRRDVDCVLPL